MRKEKSVDDVGSGLSTPRKTNQDQIINSSASQQSVKQKVKIKVSLANTLEKKFKSAPEDHEIVSPSLIKEDDAISSAESTDSDYEEFWQYSSSLAKIKYEEEKSKRQIKSDNKVSYSNIPNGAKKHEKVNVIKEMIDKNCEQFQTIRRFDKAQYHQCIPNPVNEGEMITVQLVTPKLTQTNPAYSLNQMAETIKASQEEQKLEELYCNYTFGHSRLHSMVESKYELEIKQRIGMQQHADTMTIKKEMDILSSKRALASEAIQAGQEIAIIGFWKMDMPTAKFSCYRFFYVPGPITREIKCSDRFDYSKKSTVSAYQVLFKGEHNEMFLFYGEGKKDYFVGILNLHDNMAINRSHLNETNLKIRHNINDEGIVRYLKLMNKKQVLYMKICQNPQLIRGFDEARSINDSNYVLVIPQEVNQEKQPDLRLIMYNITSGKTVKVIQEGEVYLASERKMGQTRVKYMSHSKVLKEGGIDSVDINQHDLIVEHILDDDLIEQKANDENASLIQLNYIAVDEKYSSNNQSKVLEAYLHNNSTRLTYVRQGMRSYTFDLPSHQPKSPKVKLINKSPEKSLRKDKSAKSLWIDQQSEDSNRIVSEDDLISVNNVDKNLDKILATERESNEKKHKTTNILVDALNKLHIGSKQSVKIEDALEAELKFYIESEDVRAETHKNGDKIDIYILSNIRKSRNDEDQAHATTPFYYNLYKVSEDDKDVAHAKGMQNMPSMRSSKVTELTPASMQKVKFRLNKTFSNAKSSQDSYLYVPMPLYLSTVKQRRNQLQLDEGEEPSVKIIGSMLYEEVGTGELALNFYTSSFDFFQKTTHPQQPLQQSFHVNYPILAYKHMNPDNRSIAIVHLAQNIPHQFIDLANLEFVSFVGGHFNKPGLKKQIMFLAQDTKVSGRQKLMMIETEPWERIDRKKPFKSTIKLKEFQGRLSQSPTDAQRYSSDKIRTIQFIQNQQKSDKKQETILGALVMQFDHCIATASLERSAFKRKKESQFSIHCKLPQMIEEYMIRGMDSSIYYAEKNANKDGRTSIYKLDFNPKCIKSIDTKVVYELNSRLVAMELKNYQDFIPQTNQKEQDKLLESERLYVLDDNQMIHLISKQAKSEMYESKDSFNYRKHHIVDLIDNNWSKCHISKKAIAYKDLIYRANPDNQHAANPAKAYFWYDRGSFESGNGINKLIKYKPKSRTVFEHWQVQGLNQVSSMLAIGTESRHQKSSSGGGSCFMLQPSPGSRKSHLIANDQIPLISHKSFVTNNHILIQLFNKEEDQYQTVVMEANGTVVHQLSSVQKYLNARIVGESNLKNGKKFLVTRPELLSDQGDKDLICLYFSRNGKARVNIHIEKFVNKFRFQTKQGLQIQPMSEEVKQIFVDNVTNIQLPAQGSHQTNMQQLLLVPSALNVARKIKRKAFAKSKTGTSIARKIFGLQDCLDEEKRRKQVFESQTFASKVLVSDSGKLILLSSVTLPEFDLLHNIEKQKKRLNQEPIKHDQETSAADHEGQMEVTIIPSNDNDIIQVVFNQTDIERKHPLELLQYKLVGPYLCYRNHYKHKIWIVKVIEDKEPKVKTITGNKRFIDLELLLLELDSKIFVKFDCVSPSSFLTVEFIIEKSSGNVGKRWQDRNEIKYYENLIQVTVRNETYIFNIQDELDNSNDLWQDTIQEVNFIHRMDQINDPERFVNVGTNSQSVVVMQKRGDKNYKKPNAFSLIANEQVSYYFWSTKLSTVSIKEAGQGRMGQIGQLNKVNIQEKTYSVENSGIMFRTHSYIDLLDLQYVYDAVNNKEDFHIEEDTILSTYHGHTIFSIFVESIKVFQHILDQFKEKHELGINQGKQENPIFRSLYRILIMPTDDLPIDKTNLEYNCEICTNSRERRKIKLSLRDRIMNTVIGNHTDCQCEGYFPITQKSVHFTKEKYRDILIQISLLCRETEITMFVNSLDDLNELFNKINPNLNMLFEKAFTQTRHCEQIDVLEWDQMDSLVVVPSRQSFISPKELVALMKDEKHKKTWGSKKPEVVTETLHKTFVQVRMLRTSWLFKGSEGQEVNDLVSLMESIDKNPANDETLYTNKFLMAIIEAKWSLYNKAITKFVFLPFLVYALLCIITLPYLIPAYHQNLERNIWLLYPVKVSLYILTIYNGSFEVIQMYDKKWLYLLAPANIIYMFSTLLNLALLLMDDFYLEEWDDYPEKGLVTIAVGLTWFKIFHWMRLFQFSAFFIDLLWKTFRDTNFLAFLFVYAILILTVTSMIWILNMGRENELDSEGILSNRIFPKSVNYEFIDAFFFSYITSQGEYSTDDFRGEYAGLVWIIFFASNFLIQITFFNMLIAIMDNTFQHVLANKQQSAMKERIKIISDFRLVLDKLTPQQNAKFQYIFEVRPQIENSDTGIVEAIKHSIDTNQEKILSKQAFWTEIQNEKFTNLSNEVNNMQDDIQTIKVSIKGQTQLMHDILDRLDKKQPETKHLPPKKTKRSSAAPESLTLTPRLNKTCGDSAQSELE